MKWISVKERMPKEYESVLGTNENWGDEVWYVRCCNPKGEGSFFVMPHINHTYFPVAITHWLEAPQEPYYSTPNGRKQIEIKELYDSVARVKKQRGKDE